MSATEYRPSLPEPESPGKASGTAFATLRTIIALMLREMSTRYGRSPGGYIWALVEPLGGVMVLGFGLSLLVRTPALGTSFFLFFATGYISFNLYQTTSNTIARSLNFSRPLLAYPTVTWVDAILARFFLNALTGIVIAAMILGIILVISDSRAVLETSIIVEALALTLLTGLSVGTLNCALMGLIPIWDVVWSVITRPLFFASGVFFLYEDIPSLAQQILWYNPLIHMAGLMREGVYPTYTPEYVSTLYIIGFDLIVLSFGVLLLHRFHQDILSR